MSGNNGNVDAGKINLIKGWYNGMKCVVTYNSSDKSLSDGVFSKGYYERIVEGADWNDLPEITNDLLKEGVIFNSYIRN